MYTLVFANSRDVLQILAVRGISKIAPGGKCLRISWKALYFVPQGDGSVPSPALTLLALSQKMCLFVAHKNNFTGALRHTKVKYYGT